MENLNLKVSEPHFLIVTVPLQGHINPSLELSKRLAVAGADVTFAAPVSMRRRLVVKGSVPDRLSFASFSDGFDDGGFTYDPNDPDKYINSITIHGTETLSKLIHDQNEKTNKPFTCVVFTHVLPWVVKVAREFHLPFMPVWVQPATLFDIFYYYFNGYGDVMTTESDEDNVNPSSGLINLPGLPPLRRCDIPSIVLDPNSMPFFLPAFKEQMDFLVEETNPMILINTFEELEPEALDLVPNLKMIPVGPLIPQRDDSFGAALFQDPKNYVKWLDSKPDSSVVYIAFGSLVMLGKKQYGELSKALIQCGRPFLWVITHQVSDTEEGSHEKDNPASFRQELEELGLVVSWCDQPRVLNHRSVGCFVTHCGWNSTLDCLSSGVPVVGFPQMFADQPTIAKLLEESWKTGVRVRVEEKGEDKGVVKSEEIQRCIEAVMEKEEETSTVFRRNAAKWRDLAADTVREGGSSYNNIKAFVEKHRT